MDGRKTKLEPEVTFEIAALRLHLVVGMAAADDQIDELELAELRTFVDECAVPQSQRVRLEALLDQLVAKPPALDVLLGSIVRRMDRPELAQLLIDDLVLIANVDGLIDPREEGLLRLVCGALEIDPITLYDPPQRAGADVSAAELAELVRSLLDLDAA